MALSTESSLAEFGSRFGQGGGQKYVVIDGAASDTRTIVAAVTGLKIRVLAMWIRQETGAAASWEFRSGSTVLSGENLGGIGPIDVQLVLPFSEVGWFETAAGVALTCVIGDGAIAGNIVYQEVP